MSHELIEGVELKCVFWTDGEVTVGKADCASLIVREQYGQMSMVPWVEAIYENGKKQLYNLALAEGVTVLDKRSTK